MTSTERSTFIDRCEALTHAFIAIYDKWQKAKTGKEHSIVFMDYAKMYSKEHMELQGTFEREYKEDLPAAKAYARLNEECLVFHVLVKSYRQAFPDVILWMDA